MTDMTITFGGLGFVAVGCHADGILWLERLGGFDPDGAQTVSAEGDSISFDTDGTLVDIEILDARSRFEAGGRLIETLPAAPSWLSTDLGQLWSRVEAGQQDRPRATVSLAGSDR